MKPSMTMGEVARTVFRKQPDWFYRRRATLESQYGFPAPIPLTRPMMYDPLAIDAWLAARRDARGSDMIQGAEAPEQGDDEGADIEAAREELRDRIPEIANGLGSAE